MMAKLSHLEMMGKNDPKMAQYSAKFYRETGLEGAKIALEGQNF